MALLDNFDFLETMFDDWFEKGYLLLAIPVAILIVLWLCLR